MAVFSPSQLKAEFLALRQQPYLPIHTLDLLYINIPNIGNFLTRQNVQLERSYHVMYAPTYLGLEKLLKMQGIEAGAEINLSSIMKRLPSEKFGAFVTDKGVLSGSEMEYQAVGLCFQKLENFLLVFIYDANPSQESFYKSFQKQLQDNIAAKVVILINKRPVVSFDFQKKVSCSLAMRTVQIFNHHPNFFGELLSINGLSHDELKPCHALETLPREMEVFDAETSLREHSEHVKNLFLSYEHEAVNPPSMLDSMVTRFAGFFFGGGAKKND
jgi:hypothetical protein